MLHYIDRKELGRAIWNDIPHMGADWYAAYAERLIRETDERLEENVREWMCHEPLSERRIGNYSLEMVMRIQGDGFLSALEAMNLYIAAPAMGERRIWRSAR